MKIREQNGWELWDKVIPSDLVISVLGAYHLIPKDRHAVLVFDTLSEADLKFCELTGAVPLNEVVKGK